MKMMEDSTKQFQYLVISYSSSIHYSYFKRFEGSGLSDIFVSTGIIADTSIDQTMRGKHFRRIVRALQLTYESLQCRIIRMSIDKGVNLPEYLQENITSIRAKSTDIDNIYASIIQIHYGKWMPYF